ncbi:MAG: purine-nucleoside phosphorylase [Gemmatimonadales bacterium]
MTNQESKVETAAGFLRERLEGRTPGTAIVLGSGLGGLVDRMDDTLTIPYGEIPGFHPSTVVGHKGELVLGRLAGVDVIAQAGRFHLYEGHDADTVALPVRVFAELGVERFIVTNAAGGIRRTFGPGTLMLIADHINLTFRNPLFGPALQGEERFPDMSEPYDEALRGLAHDVAQAKSIRLTDGVYAGLLGPAYETPSEVRMLERLGADAVGMSTVLEVVAARARGVRCLGVSTITNPAAGLTHHRLSHDEVMEVGRQVAQALGDLIEGVVGESA